MSDRKSLWDFAAPMNVPHLCESRFEIAPEALRIEQRAGQAVFGGPTGSRARACASTQRSPVSRAASSISPCRRRANQASWESNFGPGGGFPLGRESEATTMPCADASS